MVLSGFDIGSRRIGDGAPCLIVAEVAQAHEGSIQIAHAYIDAVADAGADAVKFQCHIAEAESTPHEPWRVKPDWPQDKSRYDYWKRMEFTQEQWARLKAHADHAGLLFLCSPFSVEAVKLLDPLVSAWKVASGEAENMALLHAIAVTGKPVLFSTGMSSRTEVLRQMRFWESSGSPFGILQCTSKYPTPPEQVGLDQLLRSGERERGKPLRLPLGLSDHSGTIYAGLAAVALGCDVLEVHVKLSEHDKGFDASSSITIEKLRELVEGVRFIEKAKQPADKDALAKELEPMRRLFMDKHRRKASYAETTCLVGPCKTWHNSSSGPVHCLA